MAIYLGSSTFNEQGDSFQIQAPLQFNAVNGLRITNFTVDVLVLVNITGIQDSKEYLMPFCQMVYPIKNVQDYPTMYGKQLGADLPSEQILIEWSTDAENDFLGTYPLALPLIPYNPPDSVEISTVTVTIAGNAQHEFPADPTAVNRTFVNLGTGTVYLAPTSGATVPGEAFTLVAGAGITILNNAVVYVTADSSGATVTLIGDHS